MLKYKVEYETINIEAKYKEQQIKYMKKKAAKLGFQPCVELVETSSPRKATRDKKKASSTIPKDIGTMERLLCI